VNNIGQIRLLSVEELTAIRGYFEFWLQLSECVAPSHLCILLTQTVTDNITSDDVWILGMDIVYGFSWNASINMNGFEILLELY
jgi:hypothetical protein